MIYNLPRKRKKEAFSETWVLNETVNVQTLVNSVCEYNSSGSPVINYLNSNTS